MLDINLKEVSLDPDCKLDEIAKLTEGYSGADITNLSRSVKLYRHQQLGVSCMNRWVCPV